MLRIQAIRNGLEDSVRVVGEASVGGAHRVDGVVPSVLQDAVDLPQGLIRRVVSAVPLQFLGGDRHAVAMRWACQCWSWWRRVMGNIRRWPSRSWASGVLGAVWHCRAASSSLDVHISWTRCWSLRSGDAPVWAVSRSMPHARVAWRMAVVSSGALGRRRMACKALLYLCQAPWSSSDVNCSGGGRAASGMVAAGGGRLGMIRSM